MARETQRDWQAEGLQRHLCTTYAAHHSIIYHRRPSDHGTEQRARPSEGASDQQGGEGVVVSAACGTPPWK